MRSLRIIWWTFFLTAFLSCEQDARLELPEVKPELVVAAFLSPENHQIEVRLSRTYDVYGGIPGKPEAVRNAVVLVYDDKDTVSLIFNSHPDSQYYQGSGNTLLIQPGITYGFYAEAPGFAPISSTMAVPDTLVKSLSYTLERHINGNGDSVFRLNVAWIDIPGQTNYYRVFAEVTDSILGVSGVRPLRYLVFFNHEEIGDLGSDGGLLQTGFGEVILYAQQNLLHRDITIHLLTTDENYFAYHKSLAAYSGNDPFSEPHNLFGNIDGGKGVFCGYRSFAHHQKIF